MNSNLSAEEKYLISVINGVIKGNPSGKIPDGLDFDRLFSLAESQKLSAFLYFGMVKSNIPAKFGDRLKKNFNFMLVADSTQTFEFESIKSLFEENNIEFIPVKGFAVKKFYPDPVLRFMCDIDFLIRPDQLDKAGQLMLSIGYGQEDAANHHDVFSKDNFINVELHKELFNKANGYYPAFADIWERKKRTDGGYSLSDEDSYLFFIAHMANHFFKAGIGLRSLIDLYFILKNSGFRTDCDYVKVKLRELGLVTFEKYMKTLAFKVFEGGDLSEYDRGVLCFFLGSGLSGSSYNRLAVSMGSSTSRRKYALARLFPPLRQMAFKYPVVEKAPVLLPFLWVKRLCSAVFFKRKGIKKEMSAIDSFDNKQVNQTAELLSQLIDK